MTSNAIAYQKYLEEARHNREMEKYNEAQVELGKQNVSLGYANVGLGYSQLGETSRHNYETESLGKNQQEFYQASYWPTQLVNLVSHAIPLFSGGLDYSTTLHSGKGWQLNGATSWVE